MGANLSCPSGFEQGTFLSCRATCPPEFKYIQEAGGVQGPPVQKCVSIRRNNRSFTLNSLPMVDTAEPIPATFEEETKRVTTERQRVLKEIDDDDRNARLLNESRDQLTENVRSYSKIETDYAVFSEKKKLVDEIQKANNALKPMRPPTAPASDLEMERRLITDDAKRSLYFIQVALFLVVLVMLSYFVFSLDTANLIAFALLCVGIAMGFFLRK